MIRDDIKKKLADINIASEPTDKVADVLTELVVAEAAIILQAYYAETAPKAIHRSTPQR